MFHQAVYQVVAGVNDVNVAMSGKTDTVFTLRSTNNFMFSEPYQIIAAAHLGVSALRCRFNIATLNQYGRHQIWPVNRSATPPSPPRYADYRDSPFVLPLYDDLGLEESGNLGAATEKETTHLLIAPMDWSRRVPRGLVKQVIRASQAVVAVADSWGGATAIVLSDTIFPGWYALTGAWAFEATSRAFRIIFSRLQQGQSRPLRPGCLVTNAVGNLEAGEVNDFNNSLGLWGIFHSADLPQVELYSDASGSVTVQLMLEVVYLGGGSPGSPPVLSL